MTNYIPANAYHVTITSGEIYLNVGIANYSDEAPYMDVLQTLIISHPSARELHGLLGRLLADLDAGKVPGGAIWTEAGDDE